MFYELEKKNDHERLWFFVLREIIECAYTEVGKRHICSNVSSSINIDRRGRKRKKERQRGKG
ncbi:hypothetical protein PGT21_012815 [Puccinia graminis f. sp. tritici]|uniref:Uncharacterized protein n=1 Tax=Puccinia graminis f. sp. tritici TaxID=56615 RepID=A0A5B0PXE1_PUCGR|nr:hypothetical protein PGT21_012815 [Puccinia graminis f. sp. tritici]